jgi:hypothetical protein
MRYDLFVRNGHNSADLVFHSIDGAFETVPVPVLPNNIKAGDVGHIKVRLKQQPINPVAAGPIGGYFYEFLLSRTGYLNVGYALMPFLQYQQHVNVQTPASTVRAMASRLVHAGHIPLSVCV